MQTFTVPELDNAAAERRAAERERRANRRLRKQTEKRYRKVR